MPPNKGRRGYCPPGCEKSWFRKGHTRNRIHAIGHERLDAKDGYVYVKVPIPNPYTGACGHYVHKHRWLWQQDHGPIPAGHVLKCLSSDKTNCDPSNWQLVPRGLLPRLNGIHGRN